MFENLSIRAFTWKREPILYITLVVAILNVVGAVLTGELALAEAAESVILLIFGFIARGQVSPVG